MAAGHRRCRRPRHRPPADHRQRRSRRGRAGRYIRRSRLRPRLPAAALQGRHRRDLDADVARHRVRGGRQRADRHEPAPSRHGHRGGGAVDANRQGCGGRPGLGLRARCRGPAHRRQGRWRTPPGAAHVRGAEGPAHRRPGHLHHQRPDAAADNVDAWHGDAERRRRPVVGLHPRPRRGRRSGLRLERRHRRRDV